MRSLLLFLLFVVAIWSCADDSVQADETVAESPAPPERVAVEGGRTGAQQDVRGFNYLTDCDSILVSELKLSDPAGGASYSYLTGECMTNKSYDVVLVPRAGHQTSGAFGSAEQVFARAKANDFEDYIAYAFIIPKLVQVDARTGESSVGAIFPVNVSVFRLDGTVWNKLGKDRAEDAAGYAAVQWKVLHDQPLRYQ